MQSEAQNQIPIATKDLEPHRIRASQLINKVSFTPGRKAKAQIGGDNLVNAIFRESSLIPNSGEENQSLLTIAKVVSKDELLLGDAANHVLTTLREGVCVAYHLVAQYSKASGLDTLKEANSKRRLESGQATEFQNKNTTAAAIGAFVLASYVVWKLSDYEVDKVSAVKMQDVELVELPLSNSIKAIDCVLFYLGLHLSRSEVVQTEIQMVKATIVYFQAVIRDIKFQQKSFGYTELFTGLRYRLVDTKFTVQGFDEPASSIIVVNEFNRLKLSEIVGNRIAKHEALRRAQRAVSYDPVAKKNPFSVIGGFQSVVMGYGFPGTGKSLQISAEATLMEEYCDAIGLKFIFHPIPGAMVSSFQGGSEERMEQWMRRARDSEHIIYMPVDDAEDKFENRINQGVSEGVKGIISVFLRETEGASAPKFGNSIIGIFTNLPEKIDPAVISRVQSRFTIDGAVSPVDFLYQDYLWWKKLKDVDPAFIDMREPKDQSWLRSQDEVSSLSEVMVDTGIPADDRIKAALAIADKNHDRKEHEFFGLLFSEVKRHYPMFTSRDVRNIQTAVNARINDFDMPDEWFAQPEIFFRQAFDRKVDMLKELMKGNMKGLTFAEIRFQEAMRYLGTLAQMANIERERKIAQVIENQEIQHEAVRRMAGRSSPS